MEESLSPSVPDSQDGWGNSDSPTDWGQANGEAIVQHEVSTQHTQRHSGTKKISTSFILVVMLKEATLFIFLLKNVVFVCSGVSNIPITMVLILTCTDNQSTHCDIECDPRVILQQALGPYTAQKKRWPNLGTFTHIGEEEEEVVEALLGASVFQRDEILRVCRRGSTSKGMFGEVTTCRYRDQKIAVRHLGQECQNGMHAPCVFSLCNILAFFYHLMFYLQDHQHLLLLSSGEENNNTSFCHATDLSVLVQMKHPNVAKVIGVCLNPPKLIVECASITLSDCLFRAHRARLNWTDRIRFMLEIASGLEYLESKSEGQVTHW